MWLTVVGAMLSYIIGFLLGRKYEKDNILDGVYGVLSKVNKNDLQIDSITYFYTQEAYDEAIKRIKETGEEYYE